MNAKYSFKDNMQGMLVLSTRGAIKLFDVDLSVWTAIEDAIESGSFAGVMATIIQGFTSNGYPLAGTVNIKRKTQNIIVIRDDNRTYLLRRGDNRLNVYTRAGEYFNAGVIPQDIKDELSAEGVNLPDTATIVTGRPDRRWMIRVGTRRMLVQYEKGMMDNVRDARYKFYKRSYRDETDLTPGEEIVGTCFYRESSLGDTGDPRVALFPAGMTGVTFRRCNLDNVSVPAGNTIEGCSTRLIRVQNDLEDWIVDVTGAPQKPLNIKAFQELGLSVDPADIPATPLDEPITRGGNP